MRFMQPWDPNWRNKGACSSLSIDISDKIFFSKRGRPSLTPSYSSYCIPCKVKAFCTAEGLSNSYGIWGGLTIKELRNLPAQIRQELEEWRDSYYLKRKIQNYLPPLGEEYLEDFDILGFDLFSEAL